MSRGLGKVERGIIEILASGEPHFTKSIARELWGEITPARLVSLRRALRKLEREHIIAREGSGSPWWVMTTTKKARAERQRARQRARERSEQQERLKLAKERAEQDQIRQKWERMAKILGMLGSSYPGEREAAALAVEAERRRWGLSWGQILGIET